MVLVVAPRAAYPVELRRQVFLGSKAIAAGLLTRRQVNGQTWRRIIHDVYADRALSFDHLVFVCGVALIMPPGAVIDGRSAAHVWGVPMAPPDQPVEVWTPVGFGPASGARIRCSPTRSGCVTQWRGLPLSTPAHAAWEIARTLPVYDTVSGSTHSPADVSSPGRISCVIVGCMLPVEGIVAPRAHSVSRTLAPSRLQSRGSGWRSYWPTSRHQSRSSPCSTRTATSSPASTSPGRGCDSPRNTTANGTRIEIN